LPEYTAVGLAAEAVSEGIKLQMVGFHNELNLTQQELLAAQTTMPELDTNLPTDTAVFLTGQRLDLIWQQLKGSLAGVGYSEADIDESMEIFTSLFGFNPDTDLLGTLNGEYVVAVLTNEEAMDLFSPLILVEHDNPVMLSSQIDQMGTGLNLLGFTTEQADETYNLSDQNGQHLLSFAQFDTGLILGMDGEGFTAVGSSTSSLADNPLYTESWNAFPDGSIPLLFLNLKELDTALNWQTAVDIQPITHAAVTTESDESRSRATIIFFIPTDSQ